MNSSLINFDTCRKLFGSFSASWVIYNEDAHDLLECTILGYTD